VKHWTLRILLCLILGAVTTVAVAWAATSLSAPKCTRAWRVPVNQDSVIVPDEVEITSQSIGRRQVIEISLHDPGISLGTAGVIASYPRGYKPPDHVPWLELSPSTRELLIQYIDSRNAAGAGFKELAAAESACVTCYNFAGWPFQSAASAQIWNDRIDETDSIVGGFSLFVGASARSESRIVLPLTPVFPGCALSTLFYGGIWFGLLSGVGAVRRGVRRRRRRCPQCGYDLRGHRHVGTPGSEARRHEEQSAGCPECGWGRRD